MVDIRLGHSGVRLASKALEAWIASMPGVISRHESWRKAEVVVGALTEILQSLVTQTPLNLQKVRITHTLELGFAPFLREVW